MKGCFLFTTILFVIFIRADAETWRPVVLMHGLLRNAESMAELASWIRADFPGIYVRLVEIGNGNEDSLFLPMNEQIERFNDVVSQDPNLKSGFNLLGQSQGGLIVRAWVERFNQPPVHNLISWVGPQEGVYGVPAFNAFCPDQQCPWFDALFDSLMDGPPDAWMQNHFSVASYWKSPFHLDEYLATNVFLADINNERPAKNETYRQNIISLNSFLLEYALNDSVVIPRTSPWFETWAPGSDTTTVPMQKSPGFIGDWIGLRTLDEANKLIRVAVPCSHEGVRTQECFPYYQMYTRPLLNNTIS